MRLRLGVLTFVLLTIATAFAAAFTFQPMFVRLDPSGQGSIQTFEVRNDGDGPLAVTFSVLTRAIGRNGVEENEDASSLFTIYPARVLVEPQSNAAVKLQWNGSGALDSERSFRLVADSVPLDSGTPATSGIRVMFRYVAAVYVGEVSFAPDLVCTVKGAAGPGGESGFNIEIVNQGKAHVVADSARIVIVDVKGRDIELEADRLGHLSGENYLPDSPRHLFVPSAEAVAGKSYDARLQFDAVY